MFALPSQNGEILPLKLVTWSTVGVTLGFLFLTTLFLLCLRAMQCNRTSIINNGATALFLSELIFILGINQADNPVIPQPLPPLPPPGSSVLPRSFVPACSAFIVLCWL